MPIYISSHRSSVSRFAAGLIVSGLLALAGCGQTETPPPAQPPAATPPPQRIVAFAPSIEEFIFALGAQERLVGVSQYCVDPPAVRNLPVLGNAVDPDLEKILAAKPDLIVTVGEGAKLRELGQAHHIPVQALRIETLEQVLAAPMAVGKLLGDEDRAKRLTARLRGDIDAVATICKKRTATPRVLVFTGEGGGGAHYTIGQGSFLSDLVTVCGGESVTANQAKPWPKLELEELAKSNPDVIILLNAVDTLSDAERQKQIDAWQAYPYFPAVKNNRVVVLTGNYLLLGGPRVTLTALDLARAIHPDLFPLAPIKPAAPASGEAPVAPVAPPAPPTPPAPPAPGAPAEAAE